MALPLPKVVPDQVPGGPLVTSLRGMNALSNDMLANQIKGVEAQYAPYTTYADAASKIAYNQYLPAQIGAQMMASPSFGLLPREQQQEFVQRYANALSTGGGGQQVLNQMQEMLSRGKPNVLSNLWNALTGGQQQPPQNVMAGPIGAQPQQGGNVFTQPPPYMGGPQQPAPVIGGQGPAVGYNTPASQQNAGMGMPGSNPVSPLNATVNQQKAAESATLGQTENETRGWDNVEKQASATSMAAIPLIKDIKGFHTAYNQSKYKGQYLGAYPTSGTGSLPTLPGHNNSPEQLAQRFANNMANDMTALLAQGGAATDSFRDMVATLKLGLDLNEGSEQVMYDSGLATAERMAQMNDFFTYFRRKNPNASYKDATAMFNKYNQYAPPFDYETFQPIEGANNRMTEFASPKALKEYQETGNYTGQKKSKKKGSHAGYTMEIETGKNFGAKGKVKDIYDANGNIVARGPLSSVQKFLSEHADKGYYMTGDENE